MSEFNFHKNILEFKDTRVEFDFPIEVVLFVQNIFIILLDPRSNTKNWGQFPNLFGVDLSGNIVWKAELPTTDTGDSYYKVKIEGGKLLAYSNCSYICTINLTNGKIVERIFTK